MGIANANNFRVLLEINSTPLAGAGIYTTASITSNQYSYFTGGLLTDQDGTLFAEFSRDGTNWISNGSYAYSANDPLGFKVPTLGDYMRFRFVNGVVAQGSFSFHFYGNS